MSLPGSFGLRQQGSNSGSSTSSTPEPPTQPNYPFPAPTYTQELSPEVSGPAEHRIFQTFEGYWVYFNGQHYPVIFAYNRWH
jgi:hypothetical protein